MRQAIIFAFILITAISAYASPAAPENFPPRHPKFLIPPADMNLNPPEDAEGTEPPPFGRPSLHVLSDGHGLFQIAVGNPTDGVIRAEWPQLGGNMTLAVLTLDGTVISETALGKSGEIIPLIEIKPGEIFILMFDLSNVGLNFKGHSEVLLRAEYYVPNSDDAGTTEFVMSRPTIKSPPLKLKIDPEGGITVISDNPSESGLQQDEINPVRPGPDRRPALGRTDGESSAEESRAGKAPAGGTYLLKPDNLIIITAIAVVIIALIAALSLTRHKKSRRK